MKLVTAGISALLVVFGAARAHAGDAETLDGVALYKKECSVCHGAIAEAKTGELAPAQRNLTHLAMASAETTMSDVPRPLSSDWRDADALNAQPLPSMHERLAVAPIYGPPLRGIIGRPAASVKGYIYSKAFVEKMTGVVWDEAKVDKWITSAQTMVPGSFMFVSIKNQDIRKKIIDYLKEQTD